MAPSNKTATADDTLSRTPLRVAYRWLEWFGILTMPPLLMAVLGYIMTGLHETGRLWILAPGLVLALLGGDFLSGIVHWSCDTYGSPTTPFVGPNIIEPFRIHHTDPKEITRHDFVEANGNSALLGILLMPPLLYGLFAWGPTVPWIAPAVAVILMLFFVAFMANQVHKWAHLDEPGPVLRWFQHYHLILNVDHHQIHHTHPHLTHYCITFGWMNHVLDAVGFWRKAEWCLARLGLKPTRE